MVGSIKHWSELSLSFFRHSAAWRVLAPLLELLWSPAFAIKAWHGAFFAVTAGFFLLPAALLFFGQAGIFLCLSGSFLFVHSVLHRLGTLVDNTAKEIVVGEFETGEVVLDWVQISDG